MSALKGFELRSVITEKGTLELSLEPAVVRDPGADEVVVRIEATPVNPSDIGNMFGPVDPSTLQLDTVSGTPRLVADVPATVLKGLARRIGMSMTVGNEGAGTVVKAGSACAHLLGRSVALMGGSMYATYRLARGADCLLLPEGTPARDGASCFVNPLTALGMTETMRREGHRALVHTAAASNLGQMLNRICLKDGIDLVNIVRSDEQVRLLRDQGAQHVCNASSAGFRAELTDALAETGATLAFDAIGGGTLASDILNAMEAALLRQSKEYSRYGSPVHKQVYIYGSLDTGAVQLNRGFGMSWGVGGWLLFNFIQSAGPDVFARMKQRVVAELGSTFASHYTTVISLRGALDPANVASYARRATGEKFLINPTLN